MRKGTVFIFYYMKYRKDTNTQKSLKTQRIKEKNVKTRGPESKPPQLRGTDEE